MMNLQIENALAARRRKSGAALSPQHSRSQPVPVHAEHFPEYTTWTGSYPLIMPNAVVGSAGPQAEKTFHTSDHVQSSTQSNLRPSKPLEPAEEDGRVTRSKALSSGVTTADFNTLLSRSSSSSIGAATTAAGLRTTSLGDDAFTQSSKEKRETVRKYKEEEDEEQEKEKEKGGKGSADSYTPSGKRRRSQPGEAKGE